MNQPSSPSSTPAVLNLHPQDELGTLIQKIIKEPAEKIKLNIPEKSNIAQGDIALRVLADRAAQLKKTLIIASPSPHVITMAKRAGLAIDPAASEVITDTTDQPDTSSTQEVASKATKSSSVGFLGWLSAHKVAVSLVSLFLLIGVGGILMALYFLPQAKITIYSEQRTIDRDVQVLASPDITQVDQEKMEVPATVVSAETSQQKTFPATGQDEVGDKATGTLTIYNKVTSSRTVPAGTVVSADNYSFSTLATVEVPAATQTAMPDPENPHDDIIRTSPGHVDVKVQAVRIGSEYNLGSGQEFAIGNYDTTSLYGENDQAFTGGSKKKVTIVTATDRQQALQSLTTQVEQEAIKKLQAKISEQQLLLEDAIDFKITSSDYSHKTGDEAEQFTLDLTASASSPVVNQADLESLLTEAIDSKVPNGYKRSSKPPMVDNTVNKVDSDGTLHLTSTFRAEIVPQIDTESLINQIKGKDPSVVEEFLKGQPNLNGYDIVITPHLPGFLYRLPSRASNITITVEVKQ